MQSSASISEVAVEEKPTGCLAQQALATPIAIAEASGSASAGPQLRAAVKLGSEPPKKRTRTSDVASRYALRPTGFKDVAGFEVQGLRVGAGCGKRLPKTQSWCFVPMIFSALGSVPEHLRGEGISTEEQIAEAQEIWDQLFSHWSAWRSELRKAIDIYGPTRFVNDFLPRSSGTKAWTTSLVYGEPRRFGRLPHPQGHRQDAVLAMLQCDTQNQIFASVMALADGS
eukprot:CAMPEP_0170582818 /NCGR_PEP_ID=MMETSP0224-20130122/7791_1 /TAXON_ID=285029 /ORGANISM="Togula jolla, Strain CCCM 725" /LENGTH=226 /DNA_ID=CAMNT_0010906077 /DNA_START=65 /DNA_END=745 /DNA_ORIENTATION=+